MITLSILILFAIYHVYVIIHKNRIIKTVQNALEDMTADFSEETKKYEDAKLSLKLAKDNLIIESRAHAKTKLDSKSLGKLESQLLYNLAQRYKALLQRNKRLRSHNKELIENNRTLKAELIGASKVNWILKTK